MQSDNVPAPKYDFIMNGGEQPNKGVPLPSGGMPRLAVFLGAGAVVLILIIVLYSVLFGGKSGGSSRITGIIGRATEISRVSTLVGQTAQDPATQNLAATTQIVLTSDSARLTAYLKTTKIKVDAKKIGAFKNSGTDSQVQTAQQNNNLVAYYDSYLRTNLATYENDISALFKTATAKQKPLLDDAFDNAKVLLNSPQLSTSAS